MVSTSIHIPQGYRLKPTKMVEYIHANINRNNVQLVSEPCIITNTPELTVTVLKDCKLPCTSIKFSDISHYDNNVVIVYSDIWFDDVVPLLPDSIISLNIISKVHFEVIFPRMLKRLMLFGGYDYALPNLLYLEELCVLDGYNFSLLGPQAVAGSPVPHLPQLRSLYIGSSMCEIQELPQSLTKLKVVSYTHKLPRLPASRLCLEIRNYNHEVNIPPHLRFLYIVDYKYPIKKLPLTLKKLTIHKYQFELPRLSRNFKEMYILSEYLYTSNIFGVNIPPRIRVVGGSDNDNIMKDRFHHNYSVITFYNGKTQGHVYPRNGINWCNLNARKLLLFDL